MVKYLRFLSVALLLLVSAVSAQTLVPLPGYATTFGPWSRGYHFTSPTNFTITGVRVPNDLGASYVNQHVEIVRFTAGAPPAYSGTTNSFVSLGSFNGVGTAIIPASVGVTTGQIIGVYGGRSTTVGPGCSSYNSYGSCVAPDGYPTTILSLSTTLYRSGMQDDLCDSPMHDIWYENCSGYYIGRVEIYYGAPLPVGLNAFSATFNNRQTDLFWDLAPDYDVASIVIERAADVAHLVSTDPQPETTRSYLNADGITVTTSVPAMFVNTDTWHEKEFAPIGSVVSGMNKNGAAGFIDTDPLNGKSFYRLKMVHSNGSVTYSNVVEIRSSDLPVEFSGMYPNPANGMSSMEISSSEPGNLTIDVFGIDGRNIHSMITEVAAGTNMVPMNFHSLPAGAYWVRFNLNGTSHTEKLIIQ